MTAANAFRTIAVAGHICLDLIPAITGGAVLMAPGKLINVGHSVLATGGAVANTGLALHRLGMDVKLMGKVGGDFFGGAILSLLREADPVLAADMIVAEGETTSYSIVMSPPDTDRMFLHCTGANDTFGADDVRQEELEKAGLFHFGYPPLMRRMYRNCGAELSALMERAKAAGATTSLDMAKPDPEGPAAEVDWRGLLARVLPHVDLFLPSVEEILYMLKREHYEELKRTYGEGGMISRIGVELLYELAEELLGMGAAVVALKLGEQGLYMRSAGAATRLERAGRCGPSPLRQWLARELYIPCFQVQVAGTTGAGDCTIAGFLAGFVKGLPPEAVMIGAVGVGACNVESLDATSGIPVWEAVRERIGQGWAQHPPRIELPGFDRSAAGGAVYRGATDGKASR